MRASIRVEVAIVYTEPTYALSRGIPQVEYRAIYVIDAENLDGAKAAALAQFESAVIEETVGWVREVQRIECRIIASPSFPECPIR